MFFANSGSEANDTLVKLGPMYTEAMQGYFIDMATAKKHKIDKMAQMKDAAIAKVHKMLKPGGLFISSTTCVGGLLKLLALITPITQRFGLLPLIRSFTVKQLEDSLIKAGFAIEYKWQPAKGKAVFIVAKKAG